MGLRDGAQAYQKLRASQVVLLDSGRSSGQVQRLRDLLRETGIEQATILSWDALVSRGSGVLRSAPSLLVSACFVGDDRQLNADLDRWCHENRQSWVRAVVDSQRHYADIGPFFDDAYPCYNCFLAIHDDQSARSNEADAGQENLHAEFLLSLLAVEIVYRLSSIGPSVVERGFQRLDLRDSSIQNLRWAPVPGCPRCRPIAAESALFPQRGKIDTGVLFEDYLGLQTRPRVPAGTEERLTEIGVELGRQFPRLSNCPRIDLPRVQKTSEVFPRTNPAETGSRQSISIEDLSVMLCLTAGLRSTDDKKVRRWAATAGNLGSVEAFLVVRDVSRLPPGVYFYQPEDHSLGLFRSDKLFDVAGFMREIVRCDCRSLPDVLILFSGVLQKLAQKYSHFAYHLLYLDAGVALSQLHYVARSLNLSSRTLLRCADDVIEQRLNFCPGQRLFTAAASISRHAVSAPAAVEFPRQFHPGLAASTKEVRSFSGKTVEQVMEMLIQESKSKQSELSWGPFKASPRAGLTQFSTGDGAQILGSTAQPVSTPMRLLARRASIRRFRSQPVSSRQLCSMIRNAYSGDLMDWPEEHLDGQVLRFFVAAMAVDGLTSGVHAYDAQNLSIVCSNRTIDREQMRELFLQEEFASAPAVIWIGINLAEACARWGAFAHRLSLIRAGAAANRLWMAALDMNLAGCIISGLILGASRRHLGLDGYEQASLVAFAVGHGNLEDPSTEFDIGNEAQHH
jgi:SagB-type dehydrogenase family enzyme